MGWGPVESPLVVSVCSAITFLPQGSGSSSSTEQMAMAGKVEEFMATKDVVTKPVMTSPLFELRRMVLMLESSWILNVLCSSLLFTHASFTGPCNEMRMPLQ